jgi:hypothetical protein
MATLTSIITPTNLLTADSTNTLTNKTINIANNTFVGTLSVSNGGTGASAPGTSGNVLTSNGTTWTSSTPASAAPTQQIFTYTPLTGTFSKSTLKSGTYSRTGQTVTVTSNGHGFVANDTVYIDFTSGTAGDGYYVTSNVATNTFTVSTSASGSTSGNANIYPPLIVSATGSNLSTGSTVYIDFGSTFTDGYYTVYQGSANTFQIQIGTTTGGGNSGNVTLTRTASSQTWTKPTNCKKILVQLVGGGSVSGTASGSSYGGCSGGYSQKLIDVTSVSTVSVTVGTYAFDTTGNSGGTSSFGAYLSATGGGTTPGAGSSGDINYNGQAPTYSGTTATGGHTIFGSGATNNGAVAASGYGAGGAMGAPCDYVPWSSAPGVVIVTEYY